MGRLIGEDELIKGRVENDPVVIAAKCTPTAYDLDDVKEEMIDALDNHFTDQINYYKELQESLDELRGNENA